MSRRIYLTGKVKGRTKKDIEAFTKQHGFEYGPFSGKTEILILGERPRKKKIQRAQEERIETHSWEKFLQKIDLKDALEKFLKELEDS